MPPRCFQETRILILVMSETSGVIALVVDQNTEFRKVIGTKSPLKVREGVR